ncbi:MAG TPA: flavin reductase family protein [Ktedonobacteraceae bacterium]|jgi:flavin reductase (DIM6/NTAB) family NADH-FMN oxidoreductase RutF|nr:flavin reductase family protein [Ktedonobacteraceae bacterium]
MAIEKQFFRQVLGRFATGVTIVTTSSQGSLAGLTVNAFCSVSLNPPLVLVCIDLNSNTLPLLRESKIFAVNMLTTQQEELSRGFSTSSAERFEHFCHAAYHTATTGAPILDNSLAFVDARIVAEYPGGDHVIFIGEVESIGDTHKTMLVEDGIEVAHHHLAALDGTLAESENEPLLFYTGQYHHMTKKYHHATATTPEHNGSLEKQAK